MFHTKDHDHDGGRSRQISAWIDCELDAESSRELEEQMRHDPELRGEVESLRELDKALAQWPAPPVTPDLRPAVLARIRKEKSAGVWRRLCDGWGDLATTAGWATAGLLAGFILMSQFPARPKASPSSDSEVMITMMIPQDAPAPSDEGGDQ
ncbi:hypothetical protein LLG95_16095 [bacterium]|nr:hypothetical protein [bacterium]